MQIKQISVATLTGKKDKVKHSLLNSLVFLSC